MVFQSPKIIVLRYSFCTLCIEDEINQITKSGVMRKEITLYLILHITYPSILSHSKVCHTILQEHLYMSTPLTTLDGKLLTQYSLSLTLVMFLLLFYTDFSWKPSHLDIAKHISYTRKYSQAKSMFIKIFVSLC